MLLKVLSLVTGSPATTISTSKKSLKLCLWLAVVALLAIPLVGANCVDTSVVDDNYDCNGYDCVAYSNGWVQCGDYDTGDFVAAEMCCVCGGGGSAGPPPSNDYTQITQTIVQTIPG